VELRRLLDQAFSGFGLIDRLLSLAGTAVVAVLLTRQRPLHEGARIRARYGQLIVPTVATADALSWAPVLATTRSSDRRPSPAAKGCTDGSPTTTK
jgi:hypothetical protein